MYRNGLALSSYSSSALSRHDLSENILLDVRGIARLVLTLFAKAFDDKIPVCWSLLIDDHVIQGATDTWK
jgi:hypothetical protein